MTMRTAVLAGALALALGAMLVGCAGTPATDGARGTLETTATSSAQSTSSADVSPIALPAAGTPGSSKSEIKAMDQQLDAMQKELDSLSMPADTDFGSAEGALY
ncbi:MAG: hypothetical protein Q7W16_00155 [Coriobacteriia bacterium]|nr:hypothetical protein [Coriobacteriia bacterium]